MAEEMVARLGDDVPQRETVVAAMEAVIADAKHRLANGTGGADEAPVDGPARRTS